jgi:hypothetical protein
MHPSQLTQGHIPQGKNQTTQTNNGGKSQTGRNTPHPTHTPYKQRITRPPKRMPRKEPTPRMEAPLSEGRVGWRGVIHRGGISHIYPDNGETVKCSTKRPNIQVLIRKICAIGYLVDWDQDPTRLSSDDKGYLKILVGTNIVHMLTVYDDTPEEHRMRPWLKHN